MFTFIFLLLLSTYSSLIKAASVPDDDDDPAVLLSFKQGVVDQNASLISWNQSSPLSSWRGVRWNGTAVVEIQLRGLGLQGKLTSNPFWCKLNSLRFLDLSSNNFTGTPFSSKWCSHSLVSLRLRYNHLTGGLSQIQSNTLQELALGFNSFHGPIPVSFGEHLPSLKILNLNEIQHTGYIPPSLGRLSKLEELYLNGNLHDVLSGEIPRSISNCTMLRVLSFSSNLITGGIDSLRFPLLQQLGVSQNKLQGRLPEHLCITSPELTTLYLDDNQLSGAIPQSLQNCTQLQSLYLDQNNFSGNIPHQLSTLKSLQYLSLSYNHLSGEIPASIFSNCTALDVFTAEWNNLEGSLPSTSLFNPMLLDLSYNHLSGRLPSNISDKVEVLLFMYNKISGGIPEHWASSICHSIVMLGLHRNMLEGSIPSWLGSCTNLFFLRLDHNNLTGTIPPELGHLPAMSSRDNELNSIKNCSICPGISMTIYLSSVVQTTSNSVNGQASMLDLDQNHLTGSIPKELGNLQSLQYLGLCNNSLSGAIPDSLSNMTNLVNLLLNNNNLSGSIPSGLGRLTFLSQFDVSNNRLEGRIPSGTQFSTFQPDWFSGNPGLCGLPTNYSCQTSPALVPPVSARSPARDGGLALPIAITSSVVFPIAFWASYLYSYLVFDFRQYFIKY